MCVVARLGRTALGKAVCRYGYGEIDKNRREKHNKYNVFAVDFGGLKYYGLNAIRNANIFEGRSLHNAYEADAEQQPVLLLFYDPFCGPLLCCKRSI